MYRHEAVEIARKMMELHGVTDELKPWVIDAVLKVAHTDAQPVPFAWFMPGEPQNGIMHQTFQPSIPGRVPMYVSSEHVSEAQHQLHLLEKSKRRTPVAWRCQFANQPGVFMYQTGSKQALMGGSDWQPLYSE